MGRDIYIYTINLQKIKEKKEEILKIYDNYDNNLKSYQLENFPEVTSKEFVPNIIDKLNNPSQFSGKELFDLQNIFWSYFHDKNSKANPDLPIEELGIKTSFETYTTDQANDFMDIFIHHYHNFNPHPVNMPNGPFYYPLSKALAKSLYNQIKKNKSKFSCDFVIPSDDSVYLVVDSY